MSAKLAECPTPVYLFNAEESRYLRLNCKRRRCGFCGVECWKPYVQAKVFRGLKNANDRYRPVRVLTLTAPGQVDSLANWNLTANQRFGAFLEEVRRHFRGVEEIDYWKVREFQRRGLIHFHGLMVGLRWVDLSWLKSVAERHGFGPRLEFHAPRGGMRALVGYYTKYVLKSAGDGIHPLEPIHSHVVTHSHGFAPEWKSRRLREGPARWVWISEAQWWAAYGRLQLIASLGGDVTGNSVVVEGGGLHDPSPPPL